MSFVYWLKSACSLMYAYSTAVFGTRLNEPVTIVFVQA